MDVRETWERRCHLAVQRTDEKIKELREINLKLEESPPELTEATNLKKKYFSVVQRTITELESLASERNENVNSQIDGVNRRNIELRRIWKNTEKNLNTLIRARDAEQSIKEYVFDAVTDQRNNFNQYAREIGRNCQETEKLKEKNRDACATAQKLYQDLIYKAVDRARHLPILEPMCTKLDKEWEQLIAGLNERTKILKETNSFWRGRDNFDWQCQSWMRHLTDLLDVCHQNMLNYEENTNYETLAINAEEYSTMCHNQHKQVAQNGKRLLGLLQDTSDDDKRIKLDMTNGVETICESLDILLTQRDKVRETAEAARKLAAFYLDAEKVTKWINKLGRPFLEKSTTIGKTVERASKLLQRHGEFESVCQNTYSNVEKLLGTGQMLSIQIPLYHVHIRRKCQQLKDLTQIFEREVCERRNILKCAVDFYVKVRDMWSIFEELRERRDEIDNGSVQSFEKKRENLEHTMNITVSEGSNLIAKLKRADLGAEQHILDLVHSIQQAKGQVNSRLASEQVRMETISRRTEWEKEIEVECEKLQEWRVNNIDQKTLPQSDFGPKITQLNNFKIKEQGKCFDLARTGRELLILLRDENTEQIEDYLQKMSKEQKLFENLVEELQTKLETQSQTEEALKNAAWTLGWIRKSEQLFQGAPCKVESLEDAEFTQQEFRQYTPVVERTERVMADFEVVQQGEGLDSTEVITRRQEVHSAWSRLQLMVEEREILIKKAIQFYKTSDEVFKVLAGLQEEYDDTTDQLSNPASTDQMDMSTLCKEIERHAAKRKLLLHATQMAHKQAYAFGKLIPSSSPARQIVSNHVTELSTAEKLVQRGWTRRKKILEHLQVYLLFQKSCRTALSQIQTEMQKAKDDARLSLPRINDRLEKIFELALRNESNNHSSKIRAWIEKIKQKHIDLHQHIGESIDHLPYDLEVLNIRKRNNTSAGSTQIDRRKSHLQAELLKTEKDYISTLKLAISVYLPAAKRRCAPVAVRKAADNNQIFGNMEELLKFHETFNEQLNSALEIEELAHCFVINSGKLSELYVEYCKGKEKSASIIEQESEGYFLQVQLEEKIEQPIQSCLIWPIQRITKYSLLLRELLECSKVTENHADSSAESKIKEALNVMESVPRKANDAMHLALLQDAPLSDLLLQGQVILSEKSVLPGVQKARERHCFLFETAIIICKRNESKTYTARISTPISKLQWDHSADTFSIWGNGNRVCLKPIDRPILSEWTQSLRSLTGRDGQDSSSQGNAKVTSLQNSSSMINSNIPPPMAIFRSLPRPLKNKLTTSEGYKNSLEV